MYVEHTTEVKRVTIELEPNEALKLAQLCIGSTPDSCVRAGVDIDGYESIHSLGLKLSSIFPDWDKNLK